ncbi:hypothetical protein AB0D12_39470 [Streptomyces sp. NPDC048479]|uniref:hypothetical protein n=1 Tax=Streptomyces sp. NPDC048479 TaxID=3154725 RepID=UPI003437E10A
MGSDGRPGHEVGHRRAGGLGDDDVRRLRRDPRASIVVAAPVGERERWVSIAGTVTVELDGAHDLASRLPPATGTSTTRPAPPTWPGILAEDQVRLVLHPETVNRYAY